MVEYAGIRMRFATIWFNRDGKRLNTLRTPAYMEAERMTGKLKLTVVSSTNSCYPSGRQETAALTVGKGGYFSGEHHDES